MANSKISGLTNLGTIVNDDEFVVIDDTDSTTKKVSGTNLYAYIVGDFLNLQGSSTVTITAGGEITPDRSYVIVQAAGGPGADNLDTITVSPTVNSILIITAGAGETITVRHGQDNIFLDGAANKVLDDPKDMLVLFQRTPTEWNQLSFANNA